METLVHTGIRSCLEQWGPLNLGKAVVSLFLMSSPLAAEGLNQQIGIGIESGFGFHQDKVFTQEGSGNRYTATDSGKPYFNKLEIGPSVSWDVEFVPALSIGIRATLLLLGPSFPYNFAPSFNARLLYDFNDWFSTSIEFPYSPGIGFEFFKHFYMFLGTDSLIVPKSDFVFSTAVLYEFPL